MTCRQNTWGVCFENICLRLVCASCVLIVLSCVFYVSVGISIHIACMFGRCIMGYECFIYSIDLCFPFGPGFFCKKSETFPYEVYARDTLNAYSLHLHIYDRCGVCARLTWLFVEVSTHLYSTDTLTRAHTHWRTRKGAAMAKECKPDCFLPPPHRYLNLYSNQLSSLPASVFAGLSALR